MQPHPAGTLIAGRYEVLGLLGAGGTGAVYRVRDTQGERIVALKEVRPDADDEARQQRFRQETAILRALRHPDIPAVHDSFVQDGRLYLAMDFVAGRSLDTLVRTEGPLDARRALDYAAQVCDILAFLHGRPQPVLHRDVKPHNLILRESDGRVVLVDFGLARPADANRSNTGSLGTLGYAPFEQMQGNAERRSDLYAVGATLAYLLTGKGPRPLKTPSLEGQVPAPVAFIVNMACQNTPNLRYASAEKMAAAIRRAAAELDRPQESSPESKAPVASSSKSGCSGVILLAIGLSLWVGPHFVRLDSIWSSISQERSLTNAIGSSRWSDTAASVPSTRR